MPAPSGLVIITPIFEDREASSRLFVELAAALDPSPFIIAVDDGSVAQPVAPDPIAAAGLHGIIIRLKRNVGHQRAIAVGLSHAAEAFPDSTCIVMDSDGEDVPATIPALVAPLKSEQVDITVARRRVRVESLQFKLFYMFYRGLFQLMTGRPISFGNFMALSPIAVKRLAAMQEMWIHIAASVLVSKLRVRAVPIDRGPRYAGRSKMNFSGLILHGFRAFMVFAEDVMVRVGILCAGIGFLSLVGIVMSVLLKAVGMATPGWFSVSLGLLILVLMQTGTLVLMSLMMTGLMRGGAILSINYRELVDEIIVVRKAGPKLARSAE